MIQRLLRRWLDGGTLEPMTDEHPRELWTVARLAEWLGVSRQAVHKRMEHGSIRPHYIVRTAGGRSMYLFDPRRVLRWRKTGG